MNRTLVFMCIIARKAQNNAHKIEISLTTAPNIDDWAIPNWSGIKTSGNNNAQVA